MRKKIVAFGEVVWDILPDGKVLGGTPSNFAFRCNSFGEEGHLLSRVGDDELGHLALKRLKELGISVADVQIDSEFPTGTVNITFEKKHEPVFDVTPDVAFDHIEFSTEALKLVRDADCLFFGLLPQRFGISKNTIRELIKESPSSIKFFDLKLFQHFFNVLVIENLLQSSQIVRIKEKEIGFLSEKLSLKQGTLEQFGEQLVKKYNVDLVLITRGFHGVFAFHKEEGAFSDSGYIIEMKDNIGSGMAFSAGFLHYYLQENSLQEALNFGNAAGALNATKVGATSFFKKSEVLRFMKKTKKRSSEKI
ncbi:carbohydrate kinase family protein [Mariniphaga sp.]|uniref:carbohydrate kinase family protein n=1 Tax=Mariniphaga sp. TaxID=1954475 RepID=UPI00356A4F92